VVDDSFLSDIPDIEFLLAPVPQLRAVESNSPYPRRILYHNTFFRVFVAANPVPIASGGPTHAKEFVYTTPHAYECPVQSESYEDDRIHPHNHNTHKHIHVSDHDAQSPRESYDVEETYSETKR